MLLSKKRQSPYKRPTVSSATVSIICALYISASKFHGNLASHCTPAPKILRLKIRQNSIGIIIRQRYDGQLKKTRRRGSSRKDE